MNPTPSSVRNRALSWLSGLAGITAAAFAGLATAADLKPGDAVDVATVSSAKFLQGDAPEAWEPGKLYMLECWATWCGPCIAAIPHVNDLHKKYQEKGLRVIGMNVWEDDEEKIGRFVTDKGDGMSYPIAYVGRGGRFETEVLTPAGVRGIPHALLIRDGKLLLGTHPSQLTDELIEKLLKGGEEADNALKGIADAERAQREAAEKQMAEAQERTKRIGDVEKSIGEALQAEDFAKAVRLADEAIAGKADLIDTDRQHILVMKTMGQMMAMDADAAVKTAKEAFDIKPETFGGQDFDTLEKMIRAQTEQLRAQKAAAPAEAEEE